MSSNRANVTKRACDGCKIRKIRCGGGHPCKACTNARLKCTYIRVQQTRGPQRLRSTTKFLIDQAQKGDSESPCQSIGELGSGAATCSVEHPTHNQRSRIPMNILAPPLYIYHVRMYPVWPIVDVEHLVFALQQDIEEKEVELYAMATAVAAATVAQLRLGSGSLSDGPTTADTFAAHCLHARSQFKSKVNMNAVCTSFFLHVYYENQQSGGCESLLYLREAISLAQMMNLHRESSYGALTLDEQQIRRRVLWLLFVTERGVCILHKLPVVLKTNISAPEADAKDEPHVLPAFLKLLNLFRLFERSKMFDVIEGEDLEIEPAADKLGFIDDQFLETLQDKLEDGSMLFDHISDVQKADLCVTRHWMRMILWKFSSKKNISYHQSPQWPTSPSFPIAVAKELLNIVSQLPRPAIEAHGLGMELKLYEIANSLADSIMKLTMLPRAPKWEFESRPSNILSRLHSILSTFRGGGNKDLVDMLYKKMAEAESRATPVLSPSLQPSHAGPPVISRLTNIPSSEAAQDDQSASVAEQAPGIRDLYGLHAENALGYMQDDTYIGPMEVHNYDDQHASEAAPYYNMSEMLFSGPCLNYSGDHDPGHMERMHSLQPGSTNAPTMSPSWYSDGSVELMVDDFLSQVPGGHFDNGSLEGSFINDGSTEQTITDPYFAEVNPH